MHGVARRGRGAQSWVRCILAALMPVVFNFVLVGAVLTWSLTDAVFPHLNASFWVFGGQVALGEIAVLGVLGLPLMRLLPRNPKFREIIRSYQKGVTEHGPFQRYPAAGVGLPGPCGIGDLGKDARDFIDFLAAAGQRYWQILPLNPPDGAYSPYLSASTFAGSTDLLSPEPFIARGALTADEVRAIDWGSDPMRVDYARVHAGRTALWDAAFARERDACCARAARRASRPNRGCATTACTWL